MAKIYETILLAKLSKASNSMLRYDKLFTLKMKIFIFKAKLQWLKHLWDHDKKLFQSISIVIIAPAEHSDSLVAL